MFTTSFENVMSMLNDGTLNFKEDEALEVIFAPSPRRDDYPDMILNYERIEYIKKIHALGASRHDIYFTIRKYGYSGETIKTILEAFENGLGSELISLLKGYESPEQVREIYSTLSK